MLQKDALTAMKMGYNVFLTGEAGTGKTHLLNKYINFLKEKRVKIGICASTGIAATHLDGVTIDSWSGLGIKEEVNDNDLRELSKKYHLVKRVQNTKVLIIDEISMIQSTRFDALDKIIRYIRKNNQPFGGLQVILSGDLFQLPPVSNSRNYIDYIFKSKAWQELDLCICYLHEPFRHKEKDYLNLLNKIRSNLVDDQARSILNDASNKTFNNNFIATKLYTHNIDVDSINQKELDKISEEAHLYFMSALGPEKLVAAMKRTCLSPEKLELKKGALVMFVRNNYEKGYFNGTIGKIAGFDGNNDPVVETLRHQKINVEPANWTISEDDKIIAQLTQHPLRLAWAITVHKSQGMTLDAAEIDLSKSFVEGMGYVALSRIKSLKGLRLLGFNEMALKVNPEIVQIDKNLRDLSQETVHNLKNLGYLKIWWRKRQFMYKLTS